MPITKLIILDRDGVVNYDSDHFIKCPEEWKPIPGSMEAIARLNQAGFKVVLATNQSGVDRGLFDMAMLNTIHDKMHKALTDLGFGANYAELAATDLADDYVNGLMEGEMPDQPIWLEDEEEEEENGDLEEEEEEEEEEEDE